MHDQPINSIDPYRYRGPDDRCSDLYGANSLCTFIGCTHDFSLCLIGNYIGNPAQSELSLNFEFCISRLINTPRNFLANSGIPVVLKVWVWVSVCSVILLYLLTDPLLISEFSRLTMNYCLVMNTAYVKDVN